MLKNPLRPATLAAFAWLVGGVVAQAPGPERWTWAELPESPSLVVALRFAAGYDRDAPDECGASRVLAECRLARARAAVTGAIASGAQVTDAATVVFVRTAAADGPLALQFVRALLDERAPLPDDVVDLAIARAALEADDADWLYPGQVLAGLCRRTLFAGSRAAHGVAGDPRAIQRLTRGRVRELLAAGGAEAGFAAGPLPRELREALSPCCTAPLAAPLPEPAAVAPAPSAPLATILNPRPKGPFVAVAFPVPRGIDRSALAVGLEVARARAAVSLPPRPEEPLARAHRVAHSFRDGEPLVLFTLRGPNGRSPDPARHDLEQLLADLRDRPVEAAEVAAAARTLRAELAVPPWSPEQVSLFSTGPEGLPGRAFAALFAAGTGLPPGAPATPEPGAVQQALAATLAPAAACWAAVVPGTPVGPAVAGRPR